MRNSVYSRYSPERLGDKTRDRSLVRCARVNRFWVSLPFLIVALCVLPAANAFAYIDAGTGSLIIQLAMGAFLGALLTVRLWWAKLKDLVARISGRRGKDDADG